MLCIPVMYTKRLKP